MQKFILSIIALFSISSLFGQFGNQRLISYNNNSSYPIKSFVVDMDNDGLNDLLTISSKILWYKNTANNEWGSPTVVDESSISYNGFPVDFDMDGDEDILIITGTGFYLKKNNGTGNFGGWSQIQTISAGIEIVNIQDYDFDGDNDIVLYNSQNARIAFYENQGNSTFIVTNITTADTNEPDFMYAEDQDSDNDLDLIVCRSSQIILFENLGNGTFSAGNIAMNVTNYSSTIQPGDLDQDGKTDLVFIDYDPGNIVWCRNLGTSFASEISIQSNLTNDYKLNVFDIDSDSDPDIVLNDFYSTELIVLVNDGTGIFDTDFTIPINDYSGILESVIPGDINGDNQNDLLLYHTQLVLLKNIDGESFENESVINYSPSMVYDFHLTDLNNDNLKDLLFSSANDQVTGYYENAGDGNFSEVKIISTAGYSNSVAIDVDEDGFTDVISFYAQNGIEFVGGNKNLGNGSFGPDYGLMNLSDQGMGYGIAEDVNNDGALDLILNSSVYGACWSQNDGLGNFLDPIVFSQDPIQPNTIKSVDVDGDGDNDVAYVKGDFSGGEIGWYEKTGISDFSAVHRFQVTTPYLKNIQVVDLNNDGLKDFATSSETENKLFYLMNIDNENVSDLQVLASNLSGIRSIAFEDFSGDGWSDFVAANFGSEKLVYCTNYENMNFSNPSVISNNFDGLKIVKSADMNNDGKLDLVSYSQEDRKFAWYENEMNLSVFEQENIPFFSAIPNPFQTKFEIRIAAQQAISRMKMEISNVAGVLVSERILTNQVTEVDLSLLPSGMYFVSLLNVVTGERATVKIVKN